MKVKIVRLAICSVFSSNVFSQAVDTDVYLSPVIDTQLKSVTSPILQSVSFVGMPPPATAIDKAAIYTKAKITYAYTDGSIMTYDLKYHMLMATNDVVNGGKVGGLYDFYESPLYDANGHMASDSPDGSSLMLIPGMSSTNPAITNALALVTQYEFKELPPTGMSGDYWSKLPAIMSLSQVYQQKSNGKLDVVYYEPIVFNDVNGGWIHCGSTLSDWNTHIGSEEYEPDAKTREGLPIANGSDDTTDINSFSNYYFGNKDTANPYHYGLVPEIYVYPRGVKVVKHYAPGRFAREMLEIAADGRTTISGDDGMNTGLFMFVADRWGELASGTLYASKVTQTSTTNGGTYSLRWIKLGHATDDEIAAVVDNGIKFSDIFDVALMETAGYIKIVTYNGTEWLRLKPGMEKAAAFLETRRYAALLGATTEFSKMEYIAFNKPARKFYLTISRVEAGMSDAVGDITVAKNDGGIVLEMATAMQVMDTNGALINSRFVGTTLTSIPELVGGWNGGTADAEGNKCQQEKICGPDNLRYVPSINTLFIGEDSTRRNNNYVWAFNLNTRILSRILSVPMNAEATGLMVATNYNGFAYILSNFQHPGSGDLPSYLGTDKPTVFNLINANWGQRKRAAIGYIGTTSGALPAF